MLHVIADTILTDLKSIKRKVSNLLGCNLMLQAHNAFMSDNNLLSKWHTELNLSWPPDLLRLAQWHERCNSTAQRVLRKTTVVFCGVSESVCVCWGALSQILYHHHVFILAGGGRADYEAKWGERYRHTRGLVATSFMPRSRAAKPSVINIYSHFFICIGHCLVMTIKINNRAVPGPVLFSGSSSAFHSG